MAKKYKSVGFKPSFEDINNEQIDSIDPYPMCIEVPEGYWTVSSTIDDYEYSYKEKK